jgi:hypothetical protein
MSKANPSSHTPARDQVLAALEACAGALRAVELAASESAKEDRGREVREQHLPQATELLREAMAELQLAEGWDPATPTSGFILAVREKRRRRLRGEEQEES